MSEQQEPVAWMEQCQSDGQGGPCGMAPLVYSPRRGTNVRCEECGGSVRVVPLYAAPVAPEATGKIGPVCMWCHASEREMACHAAPHGHHTIIDGDVLVGEPMEGEATDE